MFCTALSRSLLCCLLCFFITPLLAKDQRQPAVPGEAAGEIGLSSKGLIMSADGRWLCFNTSGGPGVVDLHSGEVRGVGDVNMRFALLVNDMPRSVWSPVASQLAFSLYREGRTFLNIWSPDGSMRDVMSVPRSLSLSGWTSPVWSADGKTLYVLVTQDLPWPKSHPDDDYPPTRSENTTIQLTEPYGTVIDRPRFEKEYEGAYAERRRSLVMAVDVATGRAGVLAKGNDIAALYLSPDNKKLVAVQPKDSMPDKPTRWTRQVYADLYLLDVRDVDDLPTIDLEEMEDRRAGWFDYREQRLKPILTDVYLNRPDRNFRRTNGTDGTPLLSWSPDSKRFAYATVGAQSTGDVFVYDIARGKQRNLTEDIELPESPKSLGYGDHYTWRYNSLKFGSLYPPLWLPDSKSLVIVGRGDVWRIPVTARGKPKSLTVNLPREVRQIVPSYSRNTAAVDNKGRITLIAKDRESRMDSLWKLDVASGRSEKQADTGVWINYMAVMSAQGDRLVYTGQAAEVSRNVYQVVGNGQPELVTELQLSLAERRYPESRILTWRTEAGEEARGLLYLPDSASKTNKVPMILDGYPGRPFSREDRRAKDGIGFFDYGLYGLLQEGFAVLYPDIEMSAFGVYERPMWQIVEAVDKAAEAAVATGVIDADRLGIMGQSYGGYMTQAVITQTDRFKAAVSRAGLSDLYGDYAAGGGSSLNWSEIGQGRLEVPPWEDPQRYTENSPHSYFDQVKTPLLLVHGQGDPIVPVEFSRQSFRALERLKNPTVFAQYRRLSHNATQEVHRRVRLWFRQHLLDGENVAGLAEQGSFFLGGDLKQDKLVTE